jgi:hypothetical protein
VGILFALPCLSSRVPPSSIISLLAAGAGRWTMEVRRWTLEAGRCTGRLARWCGGGISDVSAAEAEIDPDYIANHLHHCKWGGGGTRLARHSLRGAIPTERDTTMDRTYVYGITHYYHTITMQLQSLDQCWSEPRARSVFPHQSYHEPSRRNHWLAMPMAASAPE